MNHNHRQQRDQHDDLIQLEQAIRNKQLTGNRTIDRLISTVPRPDASRRDALEAYLVAQLTPESERKESDLMDMPVEFKRKNKPKPRHRGRIIGIAVVTLALTTLAGIFIFPRPSLHVRQFGSGFISPENTSEAEAAFSIATRLSAEATRDAGTASASNITGSDGMMFTATAIIREATLAQIAPTLTAIDAANAHLEGLSESQATATANAIFANMSLSGDERTATALIQEVTQVYVDQTATAAMILGSPVPLATPTPEPNLFIAPQTIHIPIIRMVAYDDRTQSVFAEGQRLLLFTELRLTKYESVRRVEEAGDLSAIETPLLSSTARIVRINEGPVGSVPLATIEVQVEASEYAVLKWFVENTNMQFLFIASPIVTQP